MKQFNKHILEAINRGVQLALDDYDEQECEVKPIKDIITSKSKILRDKIQFDQLIENFLENGNINKRKIQKLANLTKSSGVKFKPFSNDDFKNIVKYLISNYDAQADLNWIDTSEITDMEKLFENSRFNGDISQWDVSNVKNMEGLFWGAVVFNGDISKWDVSNVETMKSMFMGANAFNGDISKWNTSKVTDMRFMFYANDIFNGDISQWDVSNVKNMSNMFAGARSFNQDLSNWDVSNVLNYNNFKGNCPLSSDHTPHFISIF